MKVKLFLVAVLKFDKAQKMYGKISSSELKLTKVGGQPCT